MQANVRDVWSRFFKFCFGLVFEKKNLDSVQNGFRMSLVWFGLKNAVRIL